MKQRVARTTFYAALALLIGYLALLPLAQGPSAQTDGIATTGQTRASTGGVTPLLLTIS